MNDYERYIELFDQLKEEIYSRRYLAPPPPKTSPIEVPVSTRANRAKSDILKKKE